MRHFRTAPGHVSVQSVSLRQKSLRRTETAPGDVSVSAASGGDCCATFCSPRAAARPSKLWSCWNTGNPSDAANQPGRGGGALFSRRPIRKTRIIDAETRRIMARRSRQEDRGRKIVARRSWREDRGAKIAARRSRREDRGAKIVTRRSWHEDRGAKIVA